jgi:FdhD protein
MNTRDITPIPVTGAVLAGGRFARPGDEKVDLTCGVQTLLARTIEALRGLCAHVVIVTNRTDEPHAVGVPDDVPVLSDGEHHQGPLGELAAALEQSEDEWVLAVTGDRAEIDPALLRALWDGRDGAQVVVPVTDQGLEPLFALYRRDCAAAARHVLATGRRRVVAMYADLDVIEVSADGLGIVSHGPVETADVPSGDIAAPLDDSPAVVVATTRHEGRMPVERPITIYMNDVEVATTQATPEDLEELATGFLVSEGLLTRRDLLRSASSDRKRGLVYVETDEEVPDELTYRRRYITSGCGKGITFSSVGHAKDLAKVVGDLTVEARDIQRWMREMNQRSDKYQDTGGMQGCALARDGEVVFVREDVGRHNAVDKLLGRAWLDRVRTEDAVLLSTGRISYEMAVKAAKARIPIVVSKSAVTDLAAEIAGELGITVAGYARGGTMSIYTHPHRVRQDPEDADS